MQELLPPQQPSKHTPQYYIDATGIWLGKKLTNNPEKQLWALDFVRGAACFPIVVVGTETLRYVMGDRRVVLQAPEQFAKAQQLFLTYSVSKRIAILAFQLFFGSFIIPLGEEGIFRFGIQHYLFLEQTWVPTDKEYWKSKKGSCIRVMLSTSIFALAHYKMAPAKVWQVIPFGFAAALLQEKYGRFTALYGLHCAHNIFYLSMATPTVLRMSLPELFR